MRDVRRAFGRGAILLGRASPLALLLLVGCIGGPDCGASNEIRTSVPSIPNAAVLDAAHPIAEQRFTVHINAEALPTTGTAEPMLIVSHQAPIPGPRSTGATASPSTAPAIVPEVTIIREDTGEVVPATPPANGPGVIFVRGAFTMIALDCPMGEACDRTYRVRFAAPDLKKGQSVPASWSVLLDIAYTGIDTLCGAPNKGAATVETRNPVLVPAARAAFTKPVSHDEAAAPFVARHVTVTSAGPAPDAASLRLRVLQAPRVEPTDTFWRPWVRVLADGATTPAANALVGGQSYTVPTDPVTLDVPVLGDCPEGDACRRGYWILFENIEAAPPGPSVLDPRPSILGRMSWSVTATSAFERAGEAAPRLTVTVDEPTDQSPPPPSLEAAADEVILRTNKVPTALDAVFTVPERPAVRDGLDPLAASFVVVHVRGHGSALVPLLEGDGAEPSRVYFNGDGAANLVAHPFDRCPPTGPCTVTVRLVGTFQVDRYGSQATSAKLSWSVSVLGAPAGTTVTFGDPYEMPAPP